MTRWVTLFGYVVIAVSAVGLEVVARRSVSLATFGQAVTVALRRWPVRLVLQGGWLWLGWHLFVRVDWR
ncbi:MAG: hypothetical protein KY454_04110 [Actinobacteria bacterium]|nr:hypothetical protein [Actinomycetota bacterium]MBW3651275.1 hypothetical protein [Actinomycetota bacterium]